MLAAVPYTIQMRLFPCKLQLFAHIFFAQFSHLQKKYVDIHMAIHGDFFILNPRSTFSWQVLLIRLCLGLESVPTLINSDLYLQDKKEYEAMHRDRLWVSYSSIVQAAKDLAVMAVEIVRHPLQGRHEADQVQGDRTQCCEFLICPVL